MLSRDLRTLGDQLLARNMSATPIDPDELDGIIACVRDCERSAMALEAQPAPVVALDGRRPLVDAQGCYDGRRAWARLGARERDEAGGLAVELIVAQLGRELAHSCVDRAPWSGAIRQLQDRLVGLLARVLPADIAGGVLPPLPARGVLPPRPALLQLTEAAE